MRRLKTIFMAMVVAASLYAAAGTAWARTDGLERGTAWTDTGEPIVPDIGISWETFTPAF